MDYSELKELAESKKIEMQEIASALDYTTNGLRASIKKQTIPLSKLKILCEILRINPMMFFDYTPSTYVSSSEQSQKGSSSQLIENKDREIELLKQQIQDKNEIIALYREKNSPVYGIVAEKEPTKLTTKE